MAMSDSEGSVSIVSTQEQLDTVWKLGQPSHILFVIGLDPNPRVSFNYWDSLKDSLLECSDLDALYGQNNFVVDVRRWLGPPRDDYLDVGMTSPHQTVSEQLWYDYPFHMETIVDACAQDLNSGFFIAIACRSGLHRSPSVASDVAKRVHMENRKCNILVLELTKIFQKKLEHDQIAILNVQRQLQTLVLKTQSKWFQDHLWIQKPSSMGKKAEGIENTALSLPLDVSNMLCKLVHAIENWS
jgi:hypothetical protein